MKILKKSFIILCCLIFCFTPILLTGCVETEQSANTGGFNSNTGSIGSSSSTSGEPDEDLPETDIANLLTGFKLSYRAESINSEQFVLDIINEVYEISSEILSQLFYRYGPKLNSGIIVEDITYFENGTKPLFSSKQQLIQENGEPFDFGVMEYEPLYGYSQENAILFDSISGTDEYGKDVYRTWKWAYNSAWITGMNDSMNATFGVRDFVLNEKFKSKLSLAIILCINGYNLGDKTSSAMQLYNEIVSDVESKSNGDTNVFVTEMNTYLQRYAERAEHSGLMENEMEQLINFVLHELIGDELVNLDQLRYATVLASNEKTLQYTDNTDVNRRFSNEVGLFVGCNGFDKTHFSDYDQDSLSSETYDKYQNFSYYLFKILTDANYAERIINFDGSEEVKIFNDQVEKEGDIISCNVFDDMNNDGYFNTLFKTTDILENYWLDVPLPYFKNYINTVVDIIGDITKTTILQNEVEVLKYPVIPASYYINYNVADMITKENGELFGMKSGGQNYKNMVVMPKQDVNLDYMMLAFQNCSAFDFNLTVYARYYSAKDNQFATWNDSSLYLIISDTIAIESEGNQTPFLQIGVGDILSTAKLNGAEKGDCTLTVFNDSLNSYSSKSILKSDVSANYYSYLSTPAGNGISYNDANNDYLEFIFITDPFAVFQINLFMINIGNI